jgi:hypothetical protein
LLLKLHSINGVASPRAHGNTEENQVKATKTPAPKRAGTATRKIRRTKASQARLDAIVSAIGDDIGAMRRLVAAIAAIDPAVIFINS